MGRLALDGLRIIDLTQVYAGPYATKLLADMGAEVIRIESPVRAGRGSVKGRRDDHYPDKAPGERPYNRNAYYNELNRNKLAISLDLRHPKGKEVFKKLVAVGDVVIENYSARVMGNFGLEYPVLREIKPDLIMVSMPAYGMTGPYRDYVSFGTGIEAMVGMSQLTGYADGPPLMLGIAYADPTGGTNAALAVLMALYFRRKTGRGQYIDLSLREAITPLMGEAIMDYAMNRRVQMRAGNRHPFMAPHNAYRCKGQDNWVAIAVGTDEEFAAFCRVMGRPELAEDERFVDQISRWKNQEVLDGIIYEWTREREHYDVMRQLQEAGVRAGAVLNVAEVVRDPHLRARGYFEKVTHPEVGAHDHPGVSWKMSRTPGSIRTHAPLYAEHNDYVLRQLLRLSDEEIAQLEREEVITSVPKA